MTIPTKNFARTSKFRQFGKLKNIQYSFKLTSDAERWCANYWWKYAFHHCDVTNDVIAWHSWLSIFTFKWKWYIFHDYSKTILNMIIKSCVQMCHCYRIVPVKNIVNYTIDNVITSTSMSKSPPTPQKKKNPPKQRPFFKILIFFRQLQSKYSSLNYSMRR